jgi:hypothetical protein
MQPERRTFKFRRGTTRLKCPRARSRLHRRGRRYRGGGHRRRPRGLVRLAPRGPRRPTAASASQLTSACVSCGSSSTSGTRRRTRRAREVVLPKGRQPLGAVSLDEQLGPVLTRRGIKWLACVVRTRPPGAALLRLRPWSTSISSLSKALGQSSSRSSSRTRARTESRSKTYGL